MNWKLVWGLSFVPLVDMIYRAEAGLYGVDAGKAIVHAAGQWAVIFLILTLTATPLLRIFKTRTLMLYRRQLGLWTMFYSLLHLSFYLLFLLESWQAFLEDLMKRPYIIIGFLALLVLILLGITSTKSWQRRLRKKWLLLHKGVYLVAILTVIHWWMTLRSDYTEWLVYSLPLIGLLLWRVYNKYKRK